MPALHTLVVDDSPSARNVLKRLLERKGAQVDQRESGDQALDYLKTQKPDIIFMDHTMPGMNGLEAVRALRSNPDTAGIPVVMYTSESDADYEQEALASGASGVIPKPVTWNKVSEVLTAVSQHREIQADQIATSINQQLTSLRDHLCFTMENQIQLVCDEIQQAFDERLRRVEQRQSALPGSMTPGLSTLMHSITDSKLHQLNLELRHHVTAKLDVLAQDLAHQQASLKNEILQEVDQRIRTHQRYYRLPRLLKRLYRRWYHLPFWVFLSLIAGTALFLSL